VFIKDKNIPKFVKNLQSSNLSLLRKLGSGMTALFGLSTARSLDGEGSIYKHLDYPIYGNTKIEKKAISIPKSIEVAVIGSGSGGGVAANILNEKYEVGLFEKGSYGNGKTNNETFGSASILCDNGAEPQEVITLLDSERPLIQKVTFLKAAQNMKWIQHGKWIIATSIVGSFESGSARHLIVLGADIALVGSSNKKGEMRLSTRASNRIVSQGFNLTKILEKICEINEGSSGGHPGAAGYNGVGDTEAIIEIAKQESINSIRDMS